MTQKNKFAKNKQSIKQYRVSENSLNGLGSRQRPSASIGVKAYLKFSLPIVLRVRGSSEAATAIPIREIMVTSELIIIAADQARKCFHIKKIFENSPIYYDSITMIFNFELKFFKFKIFDHEMSVRKCSKLS